MRTLMRYPIATRMAVAATTKAMPNQYVGLLKLTCSENNIMS